MKQATQLVGSIMNRLTRLAKESAVISKPISVDGRYVVPVCRLALGYGGGGGEGEANGSPDASSGSGGGGGGGAGVMPLAVLIVDGNDVRLESLYE